MLYESLSKNHEVKKLWFQNLYLDLVYFTRSNLIAVLKQAYFCQREMNLIKIRSLLKFTFPLGTCEIKPHCVYHVIRGQTRAIHSFFLTMCEK